MGVSNKISKDSLKPGDHIYSWRNGYLYAHHGIYIGKGKVIHFTRGPGQEVGTGTFLDGISSSSGSSNGSKSPCAVCGDQSNVSGVILSCLDCFLRDDELYRFEYGVSPAVFALARGGTCTRAPSDPSEEVLSRASFLLKNNGFGGYNLVKNNCEDFAIYCKTGLSVVSETSVGRSGQCTAVAAAVSAVVGGLGMYFVSRFFSDIGTRRDVKKVPVQSFVTRSDLDPPTNEIATAKQI